MEFSKLNISDKDTVTINVKNCSYCNKPFTEELWCKECINSLEKLAENNDEEAMLNLVNCYKNGKGTEKNYEKAFYWYQKAAENGTEKNLEKAFYWYQKAAENAAENGCADAMNKLARCYSNGEGTEKNLEKAFYWYQKAAENGSADAMNNLADSYHYGKGTEMDFEEAFYWYQKAAENGSVDSMNNLPDSYDSGEGTEINFEKAFYWYQQAAESNKMRIIKEVKDCNKCKQRYTEYQWCKQCNTERFQKDFSKWTRGFSEIYKAIWSDGPIYSWNSDEEQWNRQVEYEVILKILNNSSNLNNKFLDEWKYHYSIPPFNHEAHDYYLIMSICEGKRPEIIKNTPKCYIDLMKKCWNPNPSDRPTITVLENIISEWVQCINKYYEINRDGKYKHIVPDVYNQLKNDMFEFVKANETNLVQEQVNNTPIIQSHPQSYYTSRKLTEILIQEEFDDCKIED
ncbi:kinase-like domain-containing protein [Rhizophagus clarus]|uniref:Kinase-like domain-containing protein n=1 Tax=Rhizophagus clarus TaxID=94130 RepID=A0A8H3KST9_9GLOM|nr:kinase-like domain-containing protein [Rhizophagus clarus]